MPGPKILLSLQSLPHGFESFFLFTVVYEELRSYPLPLYASQRGFLLFRKQF